MLLDDPICISEAPGRSSCWFPLPQSSHFTWMSCKSSDIIIAFSFHDVIWCYNRHFCILCSYEMYCICVHLGRGFFFYFALSEIFFFFLVKCFLFGPRSMDRESYLLCWFQGPFSPICDLIDLELTSWTSTISHTDWLKQAEPVTPRCKLYKVWYHTHHVFIYSNNKL